MLLVCLALYAHKERHWFFFFQYLWNSQRYKFPLVTKERTDKDSSVSKLTFTCKDFLLKSKLSKYYAQWGFQREKNFTIVHERKIFICKVMKCFLGMEERSGLPFLTTTCPIAQWTLQPQVRLGGPPLRFIWHLTEESVPGLFRMTWRWKWRGLAPVCSWEVLLPQTVFWFHTEGPIWLF